jgi:hypothetical protein
MRGRNLGRERCGGQVPCLADPARDPILQGRELAMSAAIALGLRRQVPGRGFQLHHVIDELDRDLEPLRRGPVRVPRRNIVDDPRTQLYRMRFAHPMTPISASNRENHIIRPERILNPVGKDRL